MAEKSLFFNALPNADYATGYDRNYNADDISDWLSVVFDTGVVKDGLGVTAGGGMAVNLDLGRAAINGKAYINNSQQSFTLAPNGGSSARYDYIVIRFNNNVSVRSITAELVTGTNSVPTVANLNRTDNIYDLMLCYIAVQPSTSAITQTNITDTRGDATLCPWFTAVKGYDDYYDAIVQNYESVVTLSTTTKNVVTNLPVNLWNDKYSVLEVYTNGIHESDSAYTVNTTGGYITIVFNNAKNADAVITVDLGNFIDGEGLSTAIGNYNKWEQTVANLQEANEYNYICNGTTDNANITNLVNAFLNGGSDYASLKLNIVGNFGYTHMVGGSGTAVSPYQVFNFASGSNRKVILDFGNCSKLDVKVSGIYAVVFNLSSGNLTINNLNLIATGTASGTTIRVFNNASANVVCNDCRIWVTGYQDSLIALTGTFNNCRCSVTNSLNNSYCFLTAGAGLLTIRGGTYYAYCGSNYKSAIVGQSAAGAISILYGVVAPTQAKSGYVQTNAILQLNQNGNYINCRDLVSTLTTSVQTNYSTMAGTVKVNKVI